MRPRPSKRISRGEDWPLGDRPEAFARAVRGELARVTGRMDRGSVGHWHERRGAGMGEQLSRVAVRPRLGWPGVGGPPVLNCQVSAVDNTYEVAAGRCEQVTYDRLGGRHLAMPITCAPTGDTVSDRGSGVRSTGERLPRRGAPNHRR